MPKEILRDPLYACTICDYKHPTFDLALECEQRGVKPYRFHKFQVVTYKTGDNIKLCAVVDIPGGEDEEINPHQQPRDYSLRMNCAALRNRETPPDYDYGDFNTDRITAKCHRALACPLCNSKEVTVEKDFYTAKFGFSQLFFLENIAHTKCTSCKTKFFTQDQLKVMLADAANAEAQEKVAVLSE